MEASSDIREILRLWGHATVHRFALSRTERSHHSLDKARDFAPGTKERALQELVGRDGEDRRRLMAGKIGMKGMRIVPMWAVDPVRASNDADRPHERPEIAVDQGIPEHLLWVDRAIVALERQVPLRGLIVRTEFTVSASQAVKTRMVREKYGGRLTKPMYRRELDKGVEWIGGNISQPRRPIAN